jgi:acylphosphatase
MLGSTHMTERMEAIVSGRVQGVMYRDFVQRKASGLRLTGEVQNLKDGAVRVLAFGEHGSLEKLLEKLRHGSMFSHVTNVAVSWQSAANEFKDFKINFSK